MAIYKCNSCGATTDTEATAKALEHSLGYSPGGIMRVTPPSKCGLCQSKDISLVSLDSPAPAVEKPAPPARKPAPKEWGCIQTMIFTTLGLFLFIFVIWLIIGLLVKYF